MILSGLCRPVVFLLVLSCCPATSSANGKDRSEQHASQTVFEIRGLSAEVGEDDPGILYILPWQTPTLPQRPRTQLNHQAPELLQPVSESALENHRRFRETLNPLVLKPTRLSVPVMPDDSQP